MQQPLDRRRLLAGVTGLVAVGVLAGCSETDGNSTPDGSDSDGSGGADATAEELDLREANVVGVSFEASDGSHEFDVTLHHDDDGEEGYANWWQVERLDGTQLGRRPLLHAHSRQPFTRSETIEIPDEVSCVVVRGHDQTHGYGGRATVVAVDSGATKAVDQGSDRQPVDESDCP
ncbi:MAG: hypothetical protein ACOCY1_01240 [Halovenus sp.]